MSSGRLALLRSERNLRKGQSFILCKLCLLSKMVGTSPKEIRRTYEHWIKEGEERLDDVQAEVWKRQGLDENGNSKHENIQ